MGFPTKASVQIEAYAGQGVAVMGASAVESSVHQCERRRCGGLEEEFQKGFAEGAEEVAALLVRCGENGGFAGQRGESGPPTN